MWEKIKSGLSIVFTIIWGLCILVFIGFVGHYLFTHVQNNSINTTNNRSIDSRPVLTDDPSTTNDESNDQPTGFYGTESVEACTADNGSCYTLDADIEDDSVTKLYFPKGGWIYLSGADDCHSGDTCYGYDDENREWEITRD